MKLGVADALETYVQDLFGDEKALIEAIQRLSDEIVDYFVVSFVPEQGTWPYEVEDGATAERPKDFSASTTAMIAFALRLSTGDVPESTLAPAVKKLEPLDRKKAKERQENVTRHLEVVADRFAEKIPIPAEEVARLEARHRPPSPLFPPLTFSATFGWDDPLTFTWLLELLESDDRRDAVVLRDRLCERGADVVRCVLGHPARVLQILARDEVEHSFPLLRVLQLDKTIRRIRKEDQGVERLSKIKELFEERVHRRLSESQIPHSGFDPADLVFALEGLVFTSPVAPERAIVDRTFEVLRATQEQTAYWRPQRPFKATPQGLILLPQSVEIANSLLRICNSPTLERDYFSDFVELLNAYRRWLLARVFRGTEQTADGTRPFVGWESEHTHRLDRIHLWQTSQVLIFMQHYAAMFRQHLGRKLLRLANFRPRSFERDAEADSMRESWEVWRQGEPYLLGEDGGRYRIYEQIRRDFIVPRETVDDEKPPPAAYSMLLFGPPGTGKSTIAEKLSEALEYPLLTLTPSDFITSGGEAVEARAKAIFTALSEQTDLIVLFDEIDQLLLDRESRLYREQGDVFKLMTPGMLTKLNKLAKQRSVIFIVATNYFERIDRAIKRRGRFDAHYLLLPPSSEQRRKYLKAELKDRGLTDAQFKAIAKEAVRFTYAELDQLVRAAATDNRRGADLQRLLLKEIDEAPATASLHDYVKRIEKPEKAGAREKPLEEFALLATLDLEVGRPLEERFRPLIREAIDEDAVHDPQVRTSLERALAEGPK